MDLSLMLRKLRGIKEKDEEIHLPISSFPQW